MITQREFKKMLRELLKVMTRKELAELLGVDVSEICHWLRGRHKPLRAIKLLLKRIYDEVKTEVQN